MHILTVLYHHPTDPAAFDKHYETTHAPMVDPIPGVKTFTYRKTASLDGGQPPYYLVAELGFDSLEDLQSGMGSDAGQVAVNDVPNFATGGVTMFIAHD